MFGYTTDDLIKMPVRNLYETDEDYLRTGERIFADLRVNGMSKLQTRLKRKNGSLVDCEVQMAALNTKNPLYSRMVTFREIHV
jgi:PAS domain S-box-containing protein